jgi:G3E family GTPase
MSRLYLITGFLGAGKTTFLKKFILHFQDQKMHIIVNEFGKEGIDGQLLKTIGTTLDEINNGSIFCSCRLDMFEHVLEQALKNKPDVIIVEASGLSNPTNIKKILAQPGRYDDIEYMGSICLIDAKQFPKVYDTATVVKKQLSVSDIVLINKTDLAEPAQIEEIKHTILSHRPDIPIYLTTYGTIEDAWIDSLKTPDLLTEEVLPQNKDITLRSYLITIRDSFTLYNLQKFVEMFLEDTYRVKGFVQLEGTIYYVDCVGNIFKATPYTKDVPHGLNQLVVLSGNGLPTRKAIKDAIRWYPDDVEDFTT